MSKVDFQELLNKEVIEGKQYKRDKNLEMLIQILEKKTKETEKDFMLEFEENLKVAKERGDVLQDNIDSESKSSNLSDNNILEDDGDILISDMMQQDTTSKEEDETEKEEAGIEGLETDDITEEELNEKYPQDDLTMNQKKYAYMYETAMKEYYRLKINLERQNIRDGEICYDDRNFLKLMRLKDAALKSEMWFKNSTKGKYVGELVPEIAEMENDNERECAKYQRQNNKEHEKANDRINQIKEEIEECLEDIEALQNQIAESDEIYDMALMQKLQEKSQQYVNLNEKMEMIIPNPLQLAKDEEKSRMQEEKITSYADEVKQRKDTSMNIKVIRMQNLYENQEQALDENGTNQTLNSLEQSQEKTKEKFETLIQNAIDKGDYTEAAKLNETYAELMTQDTNLKDDKEVIKNAEEFADEIEYKKEEAKIRDSVDSSIATVGAVAATGVAIATGAVVAGEAMMNNSQTTYTYPAKANVGEGELKNRLKENDVNDPETIATEDNLKNRITQIEDISKGKNVNSRTSEEKSYEENGNKTI